MNPSADAAILAFDIGTSSSRAALYDARTGEAVPGAIHAVHHEQASTPDGGATLDADTLIAEAVECARALLSARGRPPVAAVAVSTFWHSFVGVDANGKARTPILLWSDRRSRPQVERLREILDVDAYPQRTGCPLHTSYLPGRLRWLAETDRATFDACARFVSPGEYLFAQVFGLERVTCSVSMASATGLLDQEKGAWDAETLAQIPPLSPERLSPISDEPVQGNLCVPFKDSLVALADVPWFPAYGDGACSNLGCGATIPSRVALMIGTSGALRVVVPPHGAGDAPPPTPPGLWRYQADARRYLLGGALSNGGIVWDWLTDTLKLPQLSPTEMDRALAALLPDGHGLTVLPFLNGERAPSWRDDARAVIVGLTTAARPLDIARAHLEAVAFRFAAVRERLRAVAPSGDLIGSGGGLHASPAWTQILSDALGEPILVSREEQASSRGAALLVRERLGLGAVEDAPLAVERRFEPDATRIEIYQKARARQEALEARLGV